MHKVAIIGASGFTGAELLRICATHPDFEVIAATGETQAGNRIADLYPSLAGVYGDLAYVPSGDESVLDADLVFLGLPHGASQSVVPGLRGQVNHIVDLASDFRLDDPALYPAWYGDEHTSGRCGHCPHDRRARSAYRMACPCGDEPGHSVRCGQHGAVCLRR